ncbi:MAG: copper resistance protein CopC [Cryobacterium sp.]
MAPALFLALFLAAVLSIAPAMPAAAHDQVISTMPAEAEHLDGAPTEVSMTFTSEILDIGAIMLVVGADGDDWADGPPSLDGVLAVQTLKEGVPDGAYQVRWRVVSADGHPISGTVDFTVGTVTDTAGEAAAGSPPPAVSAETSTTGAGTPATTASDFPLPVTGLIGAAAGIFGYLLVQLWRRRSTPPAAPTTTTTPASSLSRNGH